MKKEKKQESTSSSGALTHHGDNSFETIQPEKSAPKIDTSR
jgi:hypothetical protein